VVADLPDVPTDRHGEAVLTWRVPATLTPHSYGLWVSPAAAGHSDCDPDFCRAFAIG